MIQLYSPIIWYNIIALLYDTITALLRGTMLAIHEIRHRTELYRRKLKII